MAPICLGPIAFDFGLDNLKASFANCRLPRRTGGCLWCTQYVAQAKEFERGWCFVAQMLDQSGEGLGLALLNTWIALIIVGGSLPSAKS